MLVNGLRFGCPYQRPEERGPALITRVFAAAALTSVIATGLLLIIRARRDGGMTPGTSPREGGADDTPRSVQCGRGQQIPTGVPVTRSCDALTQRVVPEEYTRNPSFGPNPSFGYSGPFHQVDPIEGDGDLHLQGSLDQFHFAPRTN